jgi:hypothetical protein
MSIRYCDLIRPVLSGIVYWDEWLGIWVDDTAVAAEAYVREIAREVVVH